MKIDVQKWIQSCLSLVFPPLCLHCRESIPPGITIFCDQCASLLQLIQPQKRCPVCFSMDYCPKRSLCHRCIKRKTPFALTKLAAAFDYLGPAATLIQKLKYGNQPYLAKGAAAFLALQFFELNWPSPDFIIPVPISKIKFLERGYNQSVELATHLSTYLKIPVCEVLFRRSGDFSQAGLSRQHRIALQPEVFRIKKGYSLEDKTVLLIDDVATTGSTLSCCADVLYTHFPRAVYGLTFCHAVK